MNVKNFKGESRKYRKALHARGLRFPYKGVFHVVDGDGIVVPPDRIAERDNTFSVRMGPVDMLEQIVAINTAIDKYTVLPAREEKPLPTVYKRSVRTDASGKTRTDYREVKNPKSGERYYHKPEGSKRYVEVEYSALLRKEDAA